VITVVNRPCQCAGLNRHEVEDERALRERNSEPLGPESCADTARDSAKRRQGYRRGGYSAPACPERKEKADVPLICAEGNMDRSASASSCPVRRSRRPQTRLETSCTRPLSHSGQAEQPASAIWIYPDVVARYIPSGFTTKTTCGMAAISSAKLLRQWLPDFFKDSGLTAASGQPLQKPGMKSSGLCVLGCSAFRGSERFTATVSIRQRQVL
jgi:hypothetical protein